MFTVSKKGVLKSSDELYNQLIILIDTAASAKATVILKNHKEQRKITTSSW